MIICSLPRCGATRYGLDLEEKTGLKFIGELNPIYINTYGDTAKADQHETSFQPHYSIEEYCDIINNPERYIVLVNQSPHLVVHNSDIILLRNNMKNAFISQANFFIKCRPYLKGEGILQHLYMSFQSFFGVVSYLSKNPKDIVWYEDYFGMTDTKTDYIDSHPHSKIILKHINNMFDNQRILSVFEEVRNAKV